MERRYLKAINFDLDTHNLSFYKITRWGNSKISVHNLNCRTAGLFVYCLSLISATAIAISSALSAPLFTTSFVIRWQYGI